MEREQERVDFSPLLERPADFEMPSAEGQAGYPPDLLLMSIHDLEKMMDTSALSPESNPEGQ